LPIKDRLRLWWRCGGYVRRHAWQLLFAVDARYAFRKDDEVGKGVPRLMNGVEPIYDLLTDNVVGHALAMLLLRLWFAVTWAWLSFKKR